LLTFREPLAGLGSTRDVVDHEEDPLIDQWGLLPDRWIAIAWIAVLIALISIGFWQVFVTVAEHQRDQLGDGQGYDGLCRAGTPDAAGCRPLPR
jgi:hypothetical protein